MTARLRVDRFSGIYVWILLIAFFSLTAPDTFPTTLTVKTILGDNSVTGLLALGALLAFASGLIDLSFANIAGLSLAVSTWLSIHTGIPAVPIVAIVVLGGAVVGALSGIFITRFGVNSLVTTLAVSSVALGLAGLVTAGNTLTGQWSSSFHEFGQGYVWVIPLPALYLLALALVLYYVLEHTGPGRRVLAVGSNSEAARLAGVRVARIQVGALMVSGAVAGFTGALLAAKVGVATTQTGPGYLLAAVAALFLGETQVRSRVNVWGTVIAVFLIGTGIKGLQLLGADPWVNEFFNGTVLLLAVGLAARSRGLVTSARGKDALEEISER